MAARLFEQVARDIAEENQGTNSIRLIWIVLLFISSVPVTPYLPPYELSGPGLVV